MKVIYFVIILLSGCSSIRTTPSTDNGLYFSAPGTPLLNTTTYLLAVKSQDKTYGFTERNPINVGVLRVAVLLMKDVF